MKKSINFSIIIIFSILTIAGCNNRTSETESANTQTEDTVILEQEEVAVTYVCPMHPEVTSDQPGECPKCGMDLVIKDDGTHEHDDNADSRIGQ